MKTRPMFKFRLYIAGDSQNSTRAMANLSALCRAYLPERHNIEVVDVFKDPKRALADGIPMTPTLVKLAPPSVRKIVGTLSNTRIMLDALGLDDRKRAPAGESLTPETIAA